MERVTTKRYSIESIKRYYTYFDKISDGFVPSTKKIVLSKIIFMKSDEEDELYVQIHSHNNSKTNLIYNQIYGMRADQISSELKLSQFAAPEVEI